MKILFFFRNLIIDQNKGHAINEVEDNRDKTESNREDWKTMGKDEDNLCRQALLEGQQT